MRGKRTNKRLKTQSEIKQEEEDGELQGCATPKRRNPEEPEREATTNASESEDTQQGDAGGEKTTARDGGAEAALEKRKIKEESDEEWTDDEDEESESDSDPDYESDNGSYFSDNSGGELCKRRNADVNGQRDKGGEKLSWEFRASRDTKPGPLRFRPTRPAGLAVSTSSSWTPISVFQLFCSTFVIRKIVKNTNKNGMRQRGAGVKKGWTDITVKDFYMFLTAVLHTSLVKLHHHLDYWKKGWPYGFQFPGEALPRPAFEKIRIALSLCDPDLDEKNESKKGTPEYDKLFKIKPFYTELVNACKSHFQPHSNICVHERKARKNKPLKCGYRVFALADSLTGYTWNFYIDTGKSADTSGQTAGYRAVKNLLPVSFIGTGYTLYTDGLFSSPRLFTELLDQNIGCCGILSKNHPEFPKAAQNDFPAPQASRGDIRWLRKDKLLFVKFMDTREVDMCSTVHEAFTGQVIKRPVRQGKGWVPKQFSCPDAVADFNRHMVVPGNSEFSYSMPCKRVEWHRILFYHLLDLAVVNSYILYKELLKLKGEEGARYLTQKEFREKLCKEMYTFATGCDPVDARTPVQPPARAVHCLPVYYVVGSATEGRKTCKICKSRTPVYCQKCLVPLCLTSCKNCFKQWHEFEASESEEE